MHHEILSVSRSYSSLTVHLCYGFKPFRLEHRFQIYRQRNGLTFFISASKTHSVNVRIFLRFQIQSVSCKRGLQLAKACINIACVQTHRQPCKDTHDYVWVCTQAKINTNKEISEHIPMDYDATYPLTAGNMVGKVFTTVALAFIKGESFAVPLTTTPSFTTLASSLGLATRAYASGSLLD